MLVEQAQSWSYDYGVATVQLLRGDEGGTDSPLRLWNGVLVMWDNIPKHPADAGVAEQIYQRMLRDEEKC